MSEPNPPLPASFRFSPTEHLHRALHAISPDHLQRVFSQVEELREEEVPNSGPPDTAAPKGGFDLMPFVLPGEEWAHLEEGLLQRVRAWNLFLRDLYTGQEILKAGVIPYEVVYTDPHFHRGCARLPGVTPSYLQLTAFDLQRNSRGEWLVVEEHLGVAEGASYALKKRQTMRQLVPRLFDGMEILPIEDFAAQVVDILQEQVRKSEGRVRGVLLARGSRDEHYLDHASLARQMGVSIVQGTDLVVLDSRLFLKTIAGMERVDVVLRRLPTSLLDPVTFDAGSRYGVPGLLSCVRKGRLAMANGLGSDLANNRALAAHLPSIIEYYLGEKMILASPHILELRDLDVREEVADNRDKYVVRHVWEKGAAHEWVLRNLGGEEWSAFWKRIEAAPNQFVAHKRMPLREFPVWAESGPSCATVTLRAFGLGLNRISPCALAWTGNAASPLNALVKDVWILRHASAPTASVYAQAEEAPKRLRLTSRVAESFFWMGRYAERAEVTARSLRILQMQAWPTIESDLARQRQPLWAAMAAISGHEANFFLQLGDKAVQPCDLPFYFLLDREHGGSVISSLVGCRDNAENIREHLPPEVWSVLNHLYLHVASRLEDAETEPVRAALEDRSLHQEILTQLDELTGALEKHMLHNDAWHFWQLGVYAERSQMTIVTLKQVLAQASEAKRNSSSSSNLDLLLQMLAGQYAYRSLYHARPVAARVARLLLQDEDFPRSALFCLHGMRRAVGATLGGNPTRGADTPLKHSSRIIDELNGIDMEMYFPPILGDGSLLSPEDNLSDIPTPDFAEKLDELIELLYEFNRLISDHYLDHQVVIREPELFDLMT